MKKWDNLVEILLIIGGLNWGLVGLAQWNIINTFFGFESLLARLVYVLVGIAALYHIFQWKKMKKRR